MTDKITLNGKTLGEQSIIAPPVADNVLRRMNHVEWLEQFAQVLAVKSPGSPPMTPMRLGSITRLQLAARYIQLLEKQLWATRKERANDEDGSETQADAEGR